MRNPMNIVGKIGLGMALLALMLVVGMFIFRLLDIDAKLRDDIKLRNDAVELTYAGCISDKKIENARTNVFRAVPAEYRLYVDVEYDTPSGSRSTSKYFTVSEDIYLSYDIGDYFDSRNPAPAVTTA